MGYVGGVGILRSTDGGNTWITTDYSIAAGSNDGFHFCLSTAAGTFIAGGSDGLYRSSDDGATWVQRRGGGHWYDGQISPIEPGHDLDGSRRRDSGRQRQGLDGRRRDLEQARDGAAGVAQFR